MLFSPNIPCVLIINNPYGVIARDAAYDDDVTAETAHATAICIVLLNTSANLMATFTAVFVESI